MSPMTGQEIIDELDAIRVQTLAGWTADETAERIGMLQAEIEERGVKTGPEAPLRPYLAVYEMAGKTTFERRFQAEDLAHALEQAADAQEEGETLMFAVREEYA